MDFFVEHIRMLQEQGHIVELAANMTEKESLAIHNLGCIIHNIPFSRKPLDKNNIVAFAKIKKLLIENKYDIVHCHTPNASFITRIAGKSCRKNGMRVFYTAHGFHFYKGAPILNWFIFFPAELLCSCYTDVLITINKEDYVLSKRYMQSKEIIYIPGVGINLTHFKNVKIDKNKKREDIGVPQDAILLLSVGELNANKNHESVIRALANLNNKKIHYVIAGDGYKHDDLLKIAIELKISNNIHLLGFRSDISELYTVADIFVLPSIREGLNVSIMEAMASGLPCLVSNIRGNTDLIDLNGGRLFNPKDVRQIKDCINEIISHETEKLNKMGEYNQNKVMKFSDIAVLREIDRLYKRYTYFNIIEN